MGDPPCSPAGRQEVLSQQALFSGTHWLGSSVLRLGQLETHQVLSAVLLAPLLSVRL